MAVPSPCLCSVPNRGRNAMVYVYAAFLAFAFSFLPKGGARVYHVADFTLIARWPALISEKKTASTYARCICVLCCSF